MNKLAVPMISLFMALLILFSSFFVLVQSAPFYRFLMHKNGVYESIGLPSEVVDEGAKNISDFMVGRTPHLIVEYENESLFKAQEIFHMKEVVLIFKWIFILCVVMFTLMVWGLFLVPQRKRFLRYQFYAMLLLFLFFGISALYFDQAFTLMHKVLFSNDLWTFTSEHYLIQFLPQGFFLGFLVSTILIAFLVSFVLFLLGRKKHDTNL
ncbi:lipoprotein intramolecular transacylase Lit [Guggenheimella bovis]